MCERQLSVTARLRSEAIGMMTREQLREWAESWTTVSWDTEIRCRPASVDVTKATIQALDDLRNAEAEIKRLKGIFPFVPEERRTQGTIEEQAACEAQGLCSWCDGGWRCSLPKGHDWPCVFSLVR